MVGELKQHGVVPSLLMLTFALACLVASSYGKGLGRLPSSSETGNGRQPKQLIFPVMLGLAPEQDAHVHPYILYNRHYLPAVKSAPQFGPFFGYFPNLFPAVVPTTPPTTTTTTTVAPAPAAETITCTLLSADSDSSCKPCPAGTAGGVIQSPNYPNDFGVSTAGTGTSKCQYKFATAEGRKVKVVLSAGAAFDKSTNPPLEFLQFRYGSEAALLADGQSLPTSADLSYTATSKDASFDFYFNNKVCTKTTCKWEITYSSVV